jgi:hypothetical protein
MTRPDEPPNHNPVWRLTDEYGNRRHVVACDELQAIRFAERRWGMVVTTIYRIAATLAEYRAGSGQV